MASFHSQVNESDFLSGGVINQAIFMKSFLYFFHAINIYLTFTNFSNISAGRAMKTVVVNTFKYACQYTQRRKH